MVSPDDELAARTVLYYVLGFTADEQSRLQWDAAGALVDEQSVLTRDTSRQFAFGLQLLVDGLAVRGASTLSSGREVPQHSRD